MTAGMGSNTIAGFRLSAQQERVWSQQVGAAAPFWAECELLIEGTLDESKLHDVLGELVGRHEILRTVFHRQAGLKFPFQLIQEEPDFAWRTVDLTGVGESAQRERIRGLFHECESEASSEAGAVLHAVLATLGP